MYRTNKALSLFVCSMLAVSLAACGGGSSPGSTPAPGDGEKKEDAKPVPKDPYTMTIFAPGVSVEELNTRFGEALKKKFPHITFNFTTSSAGNNITDLVSRGEIPDLIRTDIPSLYSGYLDLQLGVDLKPYIQKHKYDLNRFNQVFIREIEDYTRDGKLYGLPVPPFFPNVLYYNKDLFDKFGVDYPRDGMTWDEVYELAKKLTRTEGGTTYRGFSANLLGMLRDNPFSLPILDPEKDQLHAPEKWQSVFSNLKRFYDIPGNALKSSADESAAFGTGLSAMAANLHSVYLNIPKEINWDIVSLPTMNGAPQRVSQRGPAYWAITNTGKHKDEAFEVVMEMLSDEIQMKDALQGIPTTLANKQIQEALGKEHPIYKSKNMKAVSYYPPTDPTVKRKQGLIDIPLGNQQSFIVASFVDFATGKDDLNTVLRKLDETLKAKLAEEKEKKQAK
ncbi:ABC transporter substrate-binding protein [Paenibacillus sp. GCM10012303]|uniref:ABC transporter substrate-binding protein n=1 Tax=Paenibacillus sp. GCM10012303 TaxID=3317340 RepID=UPI003615E399